jgi:hypothetical protein
MPLLVQPVEDHRGELEHPVVVGDERQPAADRIQTGRGRFVETVIGEVGLVHDLGDVP